MRQKITLAFCAAFIFANLAHAKAKKVKFATLAPKNTPWAVQADAIKDRVHKGTDGKLEFVPYLSGQLGGELETLAKLRRNQVQAWAGSIGSLSTVVPELGVLELPYLFHSYAEVDKVLDVVFDPVSQLLAKKGIVLQSWNENGWRHMGTKVKPISSLASLKGLKMRSQQNKAHLAMWKAWGATPVTLGAPEVLTSLQTGVVEGFDGATIYTSAVAWHTAIKHFTLTGHMYQPSAIVFNKRFFDRLPANEKAALMGDPKQEAEMARKGVRKIIPAILGMIKKSGVAVHELSAKDKAVFAAKAKTVREDFRKQTSDEGRALLSAIEAELKSLRNKS